MTGSPRPSTEIEEFLMENPGWYTSREIWLKAFPPNTETFRRVRDTVRFLRQKKRIMWRVKHANETPHEGKKFYIATPVYEYRRLVIVD